MISALRTAQRVPFLSFITRMSTSSHNVALTSQKLSLPEIPELFDSNYLDVLLPASTPSTAKPPAPAGPSNVLMEALKEVSNRTHTENDAPALKSTLSGTLDAFTALTSYSTAEEMAKHLDKAWAEEPNLALRMIWQLRSVHDGKGDKEAFYRAWSWLYDNHPRTAIVNLHLLCEPVCTIKKKKKEGALGAHGYWKDILNILALATNGQLGQKYPKFLHNFVEKTEEKNTKAPIRRGKRKASGSTTDHPESDTPKIPVEENNARQKELAQARKITLADERFSLLELAVKQPKYRALYIATARLFAAQLITDISTLYRAMDMKESKDRRVQLRQISLASKWAPTMGGAHDLNTNISTAIGQLLYHSRDQIPISFPSTLQNADITSRDKDLALRYFYQRWILAPLRKTLELPERRMTANEWDKINYNRVASLCMKKNNEHFLTHDPEGFQKYLIDVESGKKSISGATLMPNELLYEILKYSMAKDNKPGKMPLLEEYRRQIADSKLRVAEAQWATLLQRVADAGTIENSLAICDVSGSMGGIGSSAKEPIMPALALTLILARVSKPPFNNGFITFSATPEFIQIDPTASVSNTVTNMVKSAWSMNTDFRAVFLDLLLPLAKNNNVKPEDMVKRLFVFSDMQFDSASTTYDHSRHFHDVETEDADKVAKDWETTYDAIEKAYVEAGYEVPQIVFWDLGNGGTKEVTADRKGVAMMNGFSAAMFKVFMGETEDDDGFDKLEDEFGKAKQDEFNPLNILKKSLMKESYDGLVVVD